MTNQEQSECICKDFQCLKEVNGIINSDMFSRLGITFLGHSVEDDVYRHWI